MRFSDINIFHSKFSTGVALIFSVIVFTVLSACQQTHTHDSNPPEGVQSPTFQGQSTYALRTQPPHAILVTEFPNQPGQPAKTSTILGAIGPAVQPAQPAQPVTITAPPPTIMQIQEQGNMTIITTRPAPPARTPTTQPMATTTQSAATEH
ncbi:MAG TPA: hypothetical protein VMG59_10155 [Phycisphaerae bacterium]|nr:hypothetical protein [Phycisphaerae bacterium]